MMSLVGQIIVTISDCEQILMIIFQRITDGGLPAAAAFATTVSFQAKADQIRAALRIVQNERLAYAENFNLDDLKAIEKWLDKFAKIHKIRGKIAHGTLVRREVKFDDESTTNGLFISPQTMRNKEFLKSDWLYSLDNLKKILENIQAWKECWSTLAIIMSSRHFGLQADLPVPPSLPNLTASA
ncbi:hypothetical protein [Paracoccus litorisediminis]|uniref:hypothetical protein n=1 Tax=Paracoccus litorisediminis TaxID=2006130 RepID=UPI0037355615